MTGLLLALALAVLGLALALRPLCRDPYEWRWVALPSIALLAMASRIRDPWLALLVSWLGLHPVMLGLALACGWTRHRAAWERLHPQLMGCCVGAGLYLALVGRIDAAALQGLAIGLVAWAVANAVFIVRPLPWLPNGFEASGLAGNGPSAAYWLSVGALSAGYLALVQHPAWLAALPALAVAAPRPRNYSAYAAMTVAVAVGSGLLWPALLAAPMGVAMVGISLRNSQSWSSRRENWGLAWRAVRQRSRWVGAGLGAVTNCELRELPGHGPYRFWTAIHNDWLQSVVELGPVPAILAAGYLVSLVAGLPAEWGPRYAATLVVFSAVYAVVYYPLRVPAQATLLIVALAAFGA